MLRPLTDEFENFLNENPPAFFDKNLSRSARGAAFRQVLGTPNTVLSTPQERLLATIDYVNGNTARVYSPQIPRSLYPYWILRLSGTYSGTEGCAGTLAAESPLPLINAIRVLADGDVVKEIDLAHLRVLSNCVFRGQDSGITAGIALGTQASAPFSARIPLDFRMLKSEKPEATFFPSRRYEQLSVEVDWAGSSATGIPNVITGGSYTGVAVAAELEIYGREVLGPAKQTGKYWINKYSQKIFPITATQAAAEFALPVGEVVRGILFSQYTNGPRTPIDTAVLYDSKIVLRANGSYRKFETTWGELTEKNAADYGLSGGMPVGYAFLDFMDHDNGGLFENAFRTNRGSGIDQLDAIVDTTIISGAFLQATMVTMKPAANFA